MLSMNQGLWRLFFSYFNSNISRNKKKTFFLTRYMKKKSYLCKRIDTISKYGNVAGMADRTIGYGRLDRKAL